jgi:hypothetical protein
MKNTKQLIYEMLTQNTGAHFLDSGGAYGRNWERNQIKSIEDFESEPEELYTYSKDWNELERTVSVFHYLSKLELDELCDEYNALPCEDWECCEDNVYGVSKHQWEWLNERIEDIKVLHTFNTYNGDSDLSQILQGSWIELNGDQYLLLQIHGGCDARGGYTDAKLFKPCEDWRIHEYLDEYKDSYSIDEDLECGYIDAFDYYDRSIIYSSDQIIEMMNNEKTK